MFITIDHIKLAANLTIKAVATKAVSDTVVANTELDEDAIRVRVGSAVAGNIIGDATRTQTDLMIDKVVDWYVARRNKKTAEEAV